MKKNEKKKIRMKRDDRKNEKIYYNHQYNKTNKRNYMKKHLPKYYNNQ